MTEPNPDIRKMIADNAGTITKNLIAFVHRTVEDLVTGGIPRAEVAEAALTVALGHYAAAKGAPALSVYLRDIADQFERLPAPPTPPAGPLN